MKQRVAAISLTVCCVIMIFSWYTLDIFIVLSESMEPTLIPGDIVLCSKYASVDRGNLVFFRYQEVGIKRVVGLPGDNISYISKVLAINGFLASKSIVRKLPADNPSDILLSQNLFGEKILIHESYFDTGEHIQDQNSNGYFLLGDNRDASVDSRQFGWVSKNSIICKGLIILATEMTDKISTHRMALLI